MDPGRWRGKAGRRGGGLRREQEEEELEEVEQKEEDSQEEEEQEDSDSEGKEDIYINCNYIQLNDIFCYLFLD